ncbi:hypothetical protein [Streptomyces pristinaespiralis]|uniref:hypothetical protein n=1 Tax=Streptomyces pristinaespiralis TaxID=38300 RepID=UPI0033D41482
MTTIFQARVASDQLQQSKEDVRRAERAQASRVTFWTDGAVAQRLHVKNGSVDPVSDLTLAFRVYEELFGIRALRGLYVRTLPGLAPCSEFVIEKNMIELEGKPLSPRMDLRVAGVAFFDSNGKEWLRTATLLTPSPADREWWELGHWASPWEPVKLTKPPVVKPVSPCS